MSVVFGAFLPVIDHDPAPQSGKVAAAARTAEELGFESVWTSDHLTGRYRILDAGLTLATVAAVTERIKLGYASLTVPVRTPARLAKEIGTLQYLSNGRLLVGADTGNSHWARWRGGYYEPQMWAAAGVPFAEHAERTDLALAALPDLLAGRPVLLGGAEVVLEPIVDLPPILVGGTAESDLRRAARYGSGWFPALAAPSVIADGVERLADLAAEYGRPRPEVTVALPISLGEAESADARAKSVETLGRIYSMPAEEAAAISILGTPEQAAEQLAAYVAAGVDRLVLSFPTENWAQHYELGAHVAELVTAG